MTNSGNHITILCSRLDLPAGTERAITNIANLLAKNGHHVTLAILDETAGCFYPLEKTIRIVSAYYHFGVIKKGNPFSRKIAWLKHIIGLRRLVKKTKPDIVISTDYVFSIASVLAGVQKFSKLVSWEPHHFYWLRKNKFWQFFFNKTYPSIHRIICLNQDEKKLFEQIGCKTVVIPGIIPYFPEHKATLDTKELLTVGWLIKRKGIDLVPSIAEKVFKSHPDWKWVIVGEGEELSSFETAIREKNLTANFTIIPPVDHEALQKIYGHASVYIMTSRSEAFPAVLFESMAHGVPSVAFDCPSGPSEIITQGEDGLLVETENIMQMAEAILSLVEDDERRKKMGAKAGENMKRLSPEAVYAKWNELFKSL